MEPMSKDKASRLRALLLQKTLHLVVRRMLLASHNGAIVRISDGSEVIVSPRLIVYQCDYMEERAVMGLKGGKTTFACTPCLAPTDMASTAPGLHHPERSVIPTVNAQLNTASLAATSGCTETVRALGMESNTCPVIPVIAAWDGLGSGLRLLNKAPGFDEIHVSH